MHPLNLPDFSHRISVNAANNTLFDAIRKKHLKVTPEEWVRQNFVWFLIDHMQYPAGLLALEMQLKLNTLIRRCDIVGFDKSGKAKLIVECKAAHISINQKTFDQIATYNLKLKVDFLIVTNGLQHYCCLMDYKNNSYQFIEEIPSFQQMTGS